MYEAQEEDWLSRRSYHPHDSSSHIFLKICETLKLCVCSILSFILFVSIVASVYHQNIPHCTPKSSLALAYTIMSTNQKDTTKNEMRDSGRARAMRRRRERQQEAPTLSSSNAVNPAAAAAAAVSKHQMSKQPPEYIDSDLHQMGKQPPEYIDSDLQPMLKQPILPCRSDAYSSDDNKKKQENTEDDSAASKTTTGRSDRRKAAGKFGESEENVQSLPESIDSSSEAPGAFAIKGLDHQFSSNNTLLLYSGDSTRNQSGVSDPGDPVPYNPHNPHMPAAAASLNSDYITEAILVQDQEEPELVFAEQMPSKREEKNLEEEMPPAIAFFANRKVQASLALLCVIVVAMVILAAILATSANREGNESSSNNDDSNQELVQRLSGPTSVPSRAPSFQPSMVPSTLAPTSLVWESLGEVISPPDDSFLFGFSLSLSADGNRVAIGAPSGQGGTVSIYKIGRDDDGYSSWNQVGNTLNDFPENNRAGTSVSISADGSTVAVGAPNADDPQGKRFTGMVEIYVLMSDEVTWERMGSPIYGEGAFDRLGGESSSISLSSDGARVSVGAKLNDADSFDSNTGSVRVYEFNGGDWVQLGQELNGEGIGDSAGFSTDISGDGRCVAIGAPNSDNPNLVSPDDAGQVYIYQLDTENGQWEQMGQALGGQQRRDKAGYSVSLSHSCTHVAVSSQVDSAAFAGNGTVEVFRFDNSTELWEQVGSSLVGAVMNDRAGFDIALSLEGSRIAIGAPYHDRSQGYVIVYDFNGSDWQALGEPLRQDDVNLSGYSISMSRDGRRIAIGSPDDFSFDSLSGSSGEARVFELQDL
jgi:hypothetical protein